MSNSKSKTDIKSFTDSFNMHYMNNRAEMQEAYAKEMHEMLNDPDIKLEAALCVGMAVQDENDKDDDSTGFAVASMGIDHKSVAVKLATVIGKALTQEALRVARSKENYKLYTDFVDELLHAVMAGTVLELDEIETECVHKLHHERAEKIRAALVDSKEEDE